MACLKMIVAIYYDYCLENGYKLWMPKTKKGEEET
jgi:putative hemolysin